MPFRRLWMVALDMDGSKTTTFGPKSGVPGGGGGGVVPTGVVVDDCAPVPWQANCCTTGPFAVPADRASTHFPLCNAVTVYQPSGVIAACAGGAALTSPTISADAASAAARLVFIGPSSAAGHGVVRAGIGRGSPR